MYRIFCESYENFIKSIDKDSYRIQIAKPFELIVDIARMYSSEIEYSDFNTVELISFFNAKSDE